MQVTVVATNAKAAELVVKERARGKFRRATATDDASDKTKVAAEPHARYRCPDLVEHPLTVSELLVFIGCHIYMGGANTDTLDNPWLQSIDEGALGVPLVANSMRLDRYKAILSHLSFMKGDDTRWLGDPGPRAHTEVEASQRSYLPCLSGGVGGGARLCSRRVSAQDEQPLLQVGYDAALQANQAWADDLLPKLLPHQVPLQL